MAGSQPRQEPEEREGRTPGGLDSGTVLMVGAVGVIVLLVTIFLVKAGYYNIAAARTERVVHARPNAEVQRYLAEQEQRLNRIEWVEEHEGQRARVPIAHAMEFILKEGLESSAD